MTKVKVDFSDKDWLETFGPEEDISSWLMGALVEAYHTARKGKRGTNDEQRIELRAVENLMLLRDEILARSYEPGRGITFIISDPVKREIFAAPFRDRILHHFIYNQVIDWWERHLIYDCYSCRKEKGTLFGVERMAKHIQSASENYKKETYVIKLDIQGYFMSLNRKRLYNRALWGLKRQFPDGGPKYQICKFVWSKIIFDDPTEGVEIRGNYTAWKNLPDSKTLFAQPPGQGIVIGNLSSQLLSNIYLDQLDHFITQTLGYKHYGRYVDDFCFVVQKDQLKKAKKDIEVIRNFLIQELNLKLHPKKVYIQEIHKGLPFLGDVIYPGFIVPGNRTIANFEKALARVQSGRKDVSDLASYLGLMVHLDSKKAQAKIFSKFGLDYNL